MYCKYCGTDIPANSEFCKKCGKKTTEEAPLKQNPLKAEKKMKKKRVIIVLSILIPLLIIILLVLSLTGLFRGCTDFYLGGITQTLNEEDSEEISFSRGNIYRNIKFEFEMSYPDNWEYDEDEGQLDRGT